jgi:3-methyladenine DNA glycosylase AlkD
MPSAPVSSARVKEVVSSLKRASTKKTLDSLPRYGITDAKAMGVSVGDIQVIARRIGKDHQLAEALWATGWYEARLLTAFIDEPERVTSAQMDRWCRDFDNWGICDTVCFHLFDRTPHAWAKIHKWHDGRAEFVKRAAFALLASVALHDKKEPDARFVESLGLIERAAVDDRNFVKKGVSWALRLIGRRNPALNDAALALSRRLAASDQPAARWIGKGAVKELTSPLVVRRLTARPS